MRALLKERFPYYIFLYEAEHVGITATGETDRVPNELVPNEYKPAAIEQTTLELYRASRPIQALPVNQRHAHDGAGNRSAFAVTCLKDFNRWSVKSFFTHTVELAGILIQPLSRALERKSIAIDKKRGIHSDLVLLSLHFDGEMEPRDADATISREISFCRNWRLCSIPRSMFAMGH